MAKISAIEITFPVGVEIPKAAMTLLKNAVMIICEKYAADNPARVMWPAGFGSKMVLNEPEEPTFDDSVFVINAAERERVLKFAREREKK